MDAKGTHLLIDLYEAADPGERSVELLRKMAKAAGCNVIGQKQHTFEGGGRTALLILSQSHVSIHTWPEKTYVAMDVYSCKRLSGDEIRKVVTLAMRETGASRKHVQVIDRGNAV